MPIRQGAIIGAGVLTVALFVALDIGLTERNHQHTCQLNFKQLGLGALHYARDWDEDFPLVANWQSDILSYTRAPGGIDSPLFNCPRVYSKDYAMNEDLNHVELSHIGKWSNVPLFSEPTLQTANAADTGESWPSPMRHRSGNGVVGLDGTFSWVQEKPNFSITLHEARLAPAKP
jgi:hypothetical protein